MLFSPINATCLGSLTVDGKANAAKEPQAERVGQHRPLRILFVVFAFGPQDEGSRASGPLGEVLASKTKGRTWIREERYPVPAAGKPVTPVGSTGRR